MSTFHKLNGKDYLSLADNHLNYFEITGAAREAMDSSTNEESLSDWSENAIDMGDYKVIPFGYNNDIPNQIQEAVLPNSLAPRLQNRKIELLFEQGPYLYEQTQDGLKYFRKPVEDTAIDQWLVENNYEEILLHNANEWFYQNQVFTKLFRNKEGRLSGGSFRKFEPLNGFDCRLAYRKNDKRKKPTHVLIGDWNKSDKKEFDVYPLFDPENPTRHGVCVHHARYKSYGLKDYALPEIFGSLEWIRRSTSIPKIFKALTENSLSIKWHIQSPAKYWEDMRKLLAKNCENSTPPKQYKEQMLEDLKKEILDKLSNILSGVENVGKFWHNEYVVEIIGANAHEHGWKIQPIEQKIQEYVKSQIEISNKADFATVAGLGLHAALGNVGADGKSDSGSEQLYALKIHQLTSVNIPEFFVCKAINDMIKIRFNTNKKIGFYHVNAEREQDITSKNRVANQLPSNTE